MTTVKALLLLATLSLFVTVNPISAEVEPTLGVGLYPGVSITGTVGTVYAIQATTNLADTTGWITVDVIQLPAANCLWTDTSPAGTGQRFYRTVAIPPDLLSIFPDRFRIGSLTNTFINTASLPDATNPYNNATVWTSSNSTTKQANAHGSGNANSSVILTNVVAYGSGAPAMTLYDGIVLSNSATASYLTISNSTLVATNPITGSTNLEFQGAASFNGTELVVTNNGHYANVIGIGNPKPLTALELGLDAASANPPQVVVANWKNKGGGRPVYVGNWVHPGWWGIGQATINFDGTLEIGNVDSLGADWSTNQTLILSVPNIQLATNALATAGILDMTKNYSLFTTNANFNLTITGINASAAQTARLILANNGSSTITCTLPTGVLTTDGSSTVYMTNGATQLAFVDFFCYGGQTSAVVTHVWH
jgi:hypothetical protein